MSDQSRIRELLLEQMSQRNAHVDFQRAVEGLSIEETGLKPEGFDHSIWELVEHIRVAQYDILEFSRNPDYESPSWPDGYWPPKQTPSDMEEWQESLTAIVEDRREMEGLIKNPENDLLAPLPHGNGQTLFREAILIVDHNAYHIGQIVQLRKALGIW
ncbi:MAG: DinB family protein [Balneolaceae bacterium]|nr:DinB family protein [Balneolaceae bacterium]